MFHGLKPKRHHHRTKYRTDRGRQRQRQRQTDKLDTEFSGMVSVSVFSTVSNSPVQAVVLLFVCSTHSPCCDLVASMSAPDALSEAQNWWCVASTPTSHSHLTFFAVLRYCLRQTKHAAVMTTAHQHRKTNKSHSKTWKNFTTSGTSQLVSLPRVPSESLLCQDDVPLVSQK